MGPRATETEILGGARVLAGITGMAPRLFRPPWGMVNIPALRIARRAGLTTVLWSIQPEGAWASPPEAQLRYCTRFLHDGAIVDLHDAPGLPGAPERLLRLMPDLLALLADRGYAPVPVGTLLAA
jgi:peptidoglycan/xylan/chitin deacetylase (PgdA/CDA1 family)